MNAATEEQSDRHDEATNEIGVHTKDHLARRGLQMDGLRPSMNYEAR
jgi:hypothetical protein